MNKRSPLQMSGPLAFCTLVFCGALSGCPGKESLDTSVDRSLAAAGESRQNVYPLAGKVTIDNQVPQLARKAKLIVMLYDPKKPDEPAVRRPYIICGPQGEFAFHTYTTTDGVRPGNYVLLVAELEFNKKHGYLGPDQLKNLYNDPEKNAQVSQFAIDHKAPGKSDFVLNLEIAGKEPATPGPNALKEIIVDR